MAKAAPGRAPLTPRPRAETRDRIGVRLIVLRTTGLARLLVLVASLATAACRHPAVPPATPLAAPGITAPDITAPILILLSLDGWRWDYYTIAATPHLTALMARGGVPRG